MTKCTAGDKMRLVLDTAAGTLVAHKNGVKVPAYITGLGGKSLRAFVSLLTCGDKVRLAA